MKKILIAMTVTTIVAGCVFTGCVKTVDSKDTDDVWTNHGNCCLTKVVKIEGHKYILMDGNYSGTIIHAESCPCRK